MTASQSGGIRVKTIQTAAAAAILMLLNGCATTSFAPPSVDLNNKTGFGQSGYTGKCMPTKLKNDNDFIPIVPTVDGAQALIDNFTYVYRCSRNRAADGRQIFEVPSLLVQVGAATALAFGAPGGIAIGGGAATGTLAAGNKYWSPQQKADFYNKALLAVMCIKNESLGLDPVKLDVVSMTQNQGRVALFANAGGSTVGVTASQRYFGLIQTNLFAVESVLEQRLSKTGTFDPEGVVAQIEKIKDDIDAKKKQAQATAPGDAKALVATKGNMAIAALTPTETAEAANMEQTLIDIETLGPRLQQCVMIAKAT